MALYGHISWTSSILITPLPSSLFRKIKRRISPEQNWILKNAANLGFWLIKNQGMFPKLECHDIRNSDTNENRHFILSFLSVWKSIFSETLCTIPREGFRTFSFFDWGTFLFHFVLMTESNNTKTNLHLISPVLWLFQSLSVYGTTCFKFSPNLSLKRTLSS